MGKRAILIVLDSVGIGAAEDSYQYGDEGCNTLKHIAESGGLHLPVMQRLGLGHLEDLPGVDRIERPLGAYGKMIEKSKGKDTTTGHWELMGVLLEHPFPTYPNGFPPDLIREFETRIGRKTLGNVVASGTEIIARLGQQHVETGFPIVYTSADSVFQIAAHEQVVSLEELYRICGIARTMLQGEHAVGRVIARPFIGTEGSFIRTPHRHDFSLEPPANILDSIIAAGHQVVGIGKIKDIFAGRGVSENHPTRNNEDGMDWILRVMREDFSGLVFVNLVDFDQLYGHRNDVDGYRDALQEFDAWLPQLMESMGKDDLLMITADHGCDPTTVGTDHTREMVPLLVWGAGIKAGVDLGRRDTFADAGRTIAEYLQVPAGTAV
ncbi:MAG: phosphopentomutase, partial [Syntrophomonadaceae bacterium]